MAIPVIDTRTSILSLEEGATGFSFQPAAINVPTSWAATGLPDGLSINASTGKITGDLGALAVGGIYAITLSATNASGTGELVLLLPIYEAAEVSTDGMRIDFDVDLLTGAVSILGMPSDLDFGPATTEKRDDGLKRAVLLVKSGDRFPVSFGLTRNGSLQDLDLTGLRMKSKEFSPDGELDLIDGGFTKDGTGNATRYLCDLYVSKQIFAAILSNYEEDSGTFVDLHSEIEFSILSSTNTFDETKVEVLSPILGSGDTISDTFVFTGVPQVEDVTTYNLDLSLNVTGRATQDVDLSLTVDVFFDTDTGLFNVSNIVGTQSGSGDAVDAYQWQATHELVSVTGTADGVDVIVETTATTAAGYIATLVGGAGDWTISGGAVVFDEMSPLTESFNVSDSGALNVETWILSDGDTAAALKTSLNALPSPFNAEVSDVFFDGQNIVIYYTALPDSYEFAGTITAVSYVASLGATQDKAGNHTVRLEGDAADEVYRRTSETFIIRAEQDLIADL